MNRIIDVRGGFHFIFFQVQAQENLQSVDPALHDEIKGLMAFRLVFRGHFQLARSGLYISGSSYSLEEVVRSIECVCPVAGCPQLPREKSSVLLGALWHRF